MTPSPDDGNLNRSSLCHQPQPEPSRSGPLCRSRGSNNNAGSLKYSILDVLHSDLLYSDPRPHFNKNRHVIGKKAEAEGVLSNVKSLYDVLVDYKKMVSNPNEPVIDRLAIVGELMAQNTKPETRKNVAREYEKNCRVINTNLRNRGEDALTGVCLVYPTQVLLIMETNPASMVSVMKWMSSVRKDANRVCNTYKIINMAHDVERRIPFFLTKVLNQPTPNLSWAPQGNADSPMMTAVKQSMKNIYQMLRYIHAHRKDRKVLDSLVEQAGECIPDQDVLSYICRHEAPFVISMADYIARYDKTQDADLVSEKTWPMDWRGKRVACPVNFESMDERTSVVWGGGDVVTSSSIPLSIKGSAVGKKSQILF